MKTLLSEINARLTVQLYEHEIIEENINSLAVYLDLPVDQLNETISNWLATVRTTAVGDALPANKKAAVIKILGALRAISNSALATTLDSQGDLGTVLYTGGGNDKASSVEALNRLARIGNDPAVSSFVELAATAIEDPGTMDVFTKQLQATIEPVMKKLLGVERKKQHGKTNG